MHLKKFFRVSSFNFTLYLLKGILSPLINSAQNHQPWFFLFSMVCNHSSGFASFIFSFLVLVTRLLLAQSRQQWMFLTLGV